MPFGSLLSRGSSKAATPPPLDTARVPAGVRVYAIGDIHGRSDLLADLHNRIRADASMAVKGTRCVVVYLGDYVDRGPDTPGVIDMLLSSPLPGFRQVFLRGNHEAQFLEFLEHDGKGGAEWLRLGGDATLHSYRAPWPTGGGDRLAALAEGLSRAVPPAHKAFLHGLRNFVTIGDFFFVHAGVDPLRPLDDQEPRDLLWIRRRFLDWQESFGKIVVHGHSTSRKPEVRGNRIGIDTGAYLSGTLTALVLEDGRRRFITT
ncbi:metallophosphoesterase [Novispirillum sp. DQ9]|uniref:metallophosphoesterase n=1 Tax=Novispirillum sp. DQ9 TaxID=3398612 RepID=UPI003C7E1768